MRAFIVRTIFLKELRETLRDRRTLFALLVLPILIHPLLLVFMGSITAADERARNADRPRVAVWGPMPPALQSAFDGMELDRREVPPPDDEAAARELLERGGAQLVVVLPRDSSARLDGDDGAAGRVYFDSIRSRSDGAHDRLKKALEKWNGAAVESRIAKRQLPAGFAHPLKLDERNLASKQREATVHIGQILPLIMLVVMLTCGFLPAADLTAGEKERGTMQTLLCAPVRPLEIVAGKYLAVAVVALLGGTANLIAMSFALARFAAGLTSVEIHFGPSLALSVFIAMVPMAMLLAALLIGIAVFARSFREAQSYLTPVIFVVLLPSMAAMRPGAELTLSNAFLPVGNVALLTGALLAGRATVTLFFLVMLANFAYAAAAMVLAARVFEVEQVLLSGEKPWKDVFGRSERTAITPSPGEAVLFCAVLLVAFFYGTLWADPMRLGVGRAVILSEVLLLLPPVLWTAIARHSFVETFRLKLPSARGAGAIVLMAAGGWSIGAVIAWLEMRFWPGAREWAEQFEGAFGQLDVATMIAFAVAPAISEEVVCRGFVMSGLANTGSKWVAVLGSAFFFGVLHMDPYRVVVAGTIGILLGFATLETGTLLGGAAIHAVNNGLAVASTRVPQLAAMRENPRFIVAGLILTAVGAWMARGSRKN
jgi:sodium transport system permease protein